MSVNKYQDHVYVIPEDDADRQIADGFVLHPGVRANQVQVVEPAGGWRPVIDTFLKEYLPLLKQNLRTHVVMIVDFDSHPSGRRTQVASEVPASVQDRVFIIGPFDTPEALRKELNRGGFEDIGQELAEECDRGVLEVWSHAHMEDNDDERRRLIEIVKPFLFQSS